MSDTATSLLVPALEGSLSEPSHGLLVALLESRQRWRDMVAMATDFAFETDAAGRFTLIAPDPALGWPAAALLGQPAEILLAEGTEAALVFRATETRHGQRAWLRRPDGSLACLCLYVAPLLDRAGEVIGARGVGMDITGAQAREDSAAATLRRAEMIEHILAAARRETMGRRIMQTVLEELRRATASEGVAVVEAALDGALTHIRHRVGGAFGPVRDTALALAQRPQQTMMTPEGLSVMVAPEDIRFGERTLLVFWRGPGARSWDGEDRLTATAASGVIRLILEHEAIQREMERQVRTDPLTGLTNRRAFLDEVPRRLDRLDREGLPGTLMLADLDHFRLLNEIAGPAKGDEVLRRVAAVLREAVRPADLVARLGGDQFLIWLDGADQLTAAERADALCRALPEEIARAAPEAAGRFGLSLGIAPRAPGSSEELDSLLRRADLAMYAVKEGGRGQWQVAAEGRR